MTETDASNLSPSESPRYQQVETHVCRQIKDGRLAPGTRLDPLSLAQSLNISRGVVQQGLQSLASRGILIRRARSGTYVADEAASLVTNRSGGGGPISTRKSHIAIVTREWGEGRSPLQSVNSLTMTVASRFIDRKRFGLTVMSYGMNQSWEQAAENLVASGVDGMLLYPADFPDHLSATRRLLDVGIKIVLLRQAISWDPLGLFAVKYDEGGALREIVSNFAGLGHRRIAVVLDRGWAPIFLNWYQDQIVSLFAEYRLDLPPEMIVSPDPHVSSSGERDCSILSTLFDRSDRPTAVIAPDEFWAMGVMRFFYRRRLMMPHDVSLAAPQNFWPHAHSVPLSAPDSIGSYSFGIKVATEHLLKLMAGEQTHEREVSIRCDMRWTESTGAPPK